MKLQIYLLVLVTMFAGLASAMFDSHPVVVGLCKHRSAMGDLNPEQCFNKKWYVWKSRGGFPFDRTGSCAGLDSKIVGNKLEILSFQYQPLVGRYVTARGEADVSYVKKKGLVFPVEYNFRGLNFTMPFNILGTDNDNWAVIYFCWQMVGMKIEMSWLMLKDRVTTLAPEHEAAISETISTVGLSLDDYDYMYNQHCWFDEPHL